MVIPFTWNGRKVLARSGDTIAAALWRQRVLALGFSRKRHRPLGISGVFLQGALVQVDGRPHVRADEARAIHTGALDHRLEPFAVDRFDRNAPVREAGIVLAPSS